MLSMFRDMGKPDDDKIKYIKDLGFYLDITKGENGVPDTYWILYSKDGQCVGCDICSKSKECYAGSEDGIYNFRASARCFKIFVATWGSGNSEITL